MEQCILALDQGTTSSRALVFDRSGRSLGIAQKPFRQVYPKPGWVEHDPVEIWETQLSAAREAMAEARIDPSRIAAVGIANQRETAVFWDRDTGEPLGPALVWQDRRTTDICRTLSARGLDGMIRERTGLLLDPYFSGTKIMWALENVPGLRARAQAGDVCFGTVDSWLVRKLTGRHLTDPSNASRTLLYDIHKGRWDEQILSALGIPRAMLPDVTPSASDFGVAPGSLLGADIPVRGVLGDQQAALLGQGCLEPGMAKVTYGTGCFCLLSTGREPVASRNRLLTTVAWDLGDGLEYALEGSVFIGGAVVQWLRDELRILSSSAESEILARSVPGHGRGVLRPRFRRPRSSPLGPRCARLSLRHHPRHAPGAHRARRAGEHRLPDTGPRGRHGGGCGPVAEVRAGGRGRVGERLPPPVPVRHPGHAARAPALHGDHRSRGCLCRGFVRRRVEKQEGARGDLAAGHDLPSRQWKRRRARR